MQKNTETVVCWLCQGVGHLSPATHADDRYWGHTCYECDGTGLRINQPTKY